MKVDILVEMRYKWKFAHITTVMTKHVISLISLDAKLMSTVLQLRKC